MNVIKITIVLFLSIFHINLTYAQNEIFKVKNVPINISGDGLEGFVDFRARAACMGEPRIQLAVDRIVIKGITYEGRYHNVSQIQGYSSDIEVEGGNLYLRGRIPFRMGTVSHSFAIQDAIIGAKLQGFLDWITIEEESNGSHAHNMNCTEWTAYVQKDIIPFITGHRLEIHKESNLGDGIFRELKGKLEDMDNAKDYLNKITNEYYRSETYNDYNLLLSKAESYDWDSMNSSIAADSEDLIMQIRNAMEEALEEQEDEEDVETTSFGNSGVNSGSSVVALKQQEKEKGENKEESKKSADEKTESNEKSDSDYDPIAASVNRHIEYEAAMEEAKAAEARGDKAAALKAYERAQAYNGNPELQRKIDMYRGEIAFGNMGIAIAKTLMGDPEKQQREWNRKSNERRAARDAIVLEHRNKWLDNRIELVEYNLRALFLLTGDDSFIKKNLTYQDMVTELPRVRDVSNDMQKHSPDKYIEKIMSSSQEFHGDSVYLFAYKEETNSYVTNIGFFGYQNATSKMLNNRLPGNPVTKNDLMSVMPLPEMTLHYSKIISISTKDFIDAAEKSAKGEFTKDFLGCLRPFEYTSGKSDEVLLITGDSRDNTEKIRQNLIKVTESSIVKSQGNFNPVLILSPTSAIAKVLLKEGADINKKFTFEGWSPINMAAKEGKTDLLKVYVDHGADVNDVNNLGATPLLYAIRNGDMEAVRLLIEAGADVSLEGEYFWEQKTYTPLAATRLYEQKDIEELLLATLENSTRASNKIETRASKKIELGQSVDLLEKRPFRKAKRSKLVPDNCLVFEDFTKEFPVEEGIGGTLYERKNGRAYLKEPPGPYMGTKSWDLSSKTNMFILQLDIRYESGKTSEGAGVGLTDEAGNRIDFMFNAPKGKMMVGFKEKNKNNKQLVKWEYNFLMKQVENIITILGVKNVLYLYINNKLIYTLSNYTTHFEKLYINVFPGHHYSFDDIVLLDLKRK